MKRQPGTWFLPSMVGPDLGQRLYRSEQRASVVTWHTSCAGFLRAFPFQHIMCHVVSLA